MTAADAARVRRLMNQVFTPSYPVRGRDLFKGRAAQIERIHSIIPGPGRHAVLAGPRGVGKTSLANIVAATLTDFLVARTSCETTDTFRTIWTRLFQNAGLGMERQGLGLVGGPTHYEDAEGLLGEAPAPHRVADIIGRLETASVWILDEYQLLADTAAKSATASLVKNISDNYGHVTLVIVGVAGTVRELVGDHPSVGRNLVGVEIPPLADDDIKAIVSEGNTTLGIGLPDEVLAEIASLACGLPHYAHLLGLTIARTFVDTGGRPVDKRAFDDFACTYAVEDAMQTYRDAFTQATRPAQSNQYHKLLCACGYAPLDEYGAFRAADVVAAHGEVFGRTVGGPAVKEALQAFTEDARDKVLTQVKLGRSTVYEFTEPMMRPFVRIKAKTLK